MALRRTGLVLSVLLAAAVLLAGCGGGGTAPEPAAERGLLAGKSLLLVTIDTLRADRLGSYGDERAETPRLDRLAAEGVRFRDVYSPVPLTLPTHSVMFTGRSPVATGVRINGVHYLDEAEHTLAERFREAGYATGAVVSAYVMVSKFGLAQGFDLYEDSLAMDNVYRFYAEIPADEAVDRLERWLDGLPPDRPFFAWLHLYDPHQPYEPPSPWSERFPDDPYRGEIAFVDEQLGRLLDGLAERGRADDTAVVVTSDHGEAFGEHGEWGHGLLAYDETLRVPLLVHAPGIVPAGRVVEERVSLYDLAPTLVDLFALDGEIAGREGAPGRNLVPALLGTGPLPPADVYFETLAGENKGWAPLTGFVAGGGEDDGLKYIDVPQPEIYDLARDPGETRNLLSQDVFLEPEESSRGRRAYRRLDSRLDEIVSTAAPGGARRAEREMTEEDRQKLSALGYLGGGGAHSREGSEGLDPKRAIAIENRVREIRTAALDGGERAIAGAETALERLRNENPDVELPDLYELEFFIHRQRGETDAAVEALEAGLARFPDFASLELRLATYLEEIGRLDEAERHARSLLVRDPRNSQAHSLLGMTAEKRGDLEGARRSFEEALALEPRSVPLRAKVAELSLRAGDAQRARGLYDELLAEGALDDSPEQLGRSAMLDTALGNLERAEATLRRVVEMDPAAVHRLSLGMVLVRQGDLAAAADELRAALAADDRPLDPAQRQLARGLLQQVGG